MLTGINLIHAGWAVIAGLIVGYLWGKYSGIREGEERANKQMKQQMANAAYMQAMQEMMRRHS